MRTIVRMDTDPRTKLQHSQNGDGALSPGPAASTKMQYTAAMGQGSMGQAMALLARIGARVRTARLVRRWSLRQLAQRAALSARFLGELEAGRSNISVCNLAQVAAALDTSPEKLIGEVPPKSLPKIISLLGVRGAGKTSIGQRVSRRLKVPLVELDRWVEDAAGLRLREIFDTHGEAHYRSLERQALEAVLSAGSPCVLAVGGGLVTNADAWTHLRARAFTVWLRADPEDHMRRVLAQGDRRPMAGRPAPMRELEQLLQRRAPLYSLAEFTIDTSRLGLNGTLKSLLEALA